MKAHAVSMIISNAFDALSEAVSDARINTASEFHCREVMDHYLQPESGLLHEYLNVDNTTADTPAGRAVVPGHVLESMWFQIHQLRCSKTFLTGICESCDSSPLGKG